MTLYAAVRQAIADAPCSLRALAREAGLPHARLVRIKLGKAVVLTPADAVKIADALARWGRGCDRSVTRIRTALQSLPPQRKR
jgi:hypothetical protein